LPEYTAPERTLRPIKIGKPRPYEGRVSVLTRRTLTNLPLRIPAMDWSSVVTGQKGIFRCYSERHIDRCDPVIAPDVEVPRPCLMFAVRHRHSPRGRTWEAIPGVLLSHRQEPLGAITKEDLALEGFERLVDFKAWWCKRYRTLGWRPWDAVSVIEVRPWNEADFSTWGEWSLRSLYGEWFV
jgi:hypothetical protein